jgi:hypothetical protein
MKRSFLPLSLFLSLLVTGCVKDANTGSSTITFQLKAASSSVNGAAITWTAGSAGVANDKIEARKNDSTAVEFKASPNLQVDLFGAVNITNVAVPSGTFRNVEVRSELQPMGGQPSLHLQGTYTAGGVTTPVTFDVATAVNVTTHLDSIVITAAASYTALTTVTLVTLTQDVTEADMKLADRVSGNIVISATSSTTVYNKMLANLVKPQVITFH